MRNRVVCACILVLVSGVASAALSHHTVNFTLANTGSGVSDARLRMHIDTLAVPGEDYFIDNVSLNCGGPEIIVNGDFGSGQPPWKFYTNAPIPKPTLDIVGGEAVISFGSDGSNTQLFQKDLSLPAAGTPCTLEFDACSTGGPDDPGFGHNLGLKLIKHNAPPYTNYGLNLSGNPSNPEVDLLSCSAGPFCGDGSVDTGDGEQCDDGNTQSGDGCSSTCQLEPAATIVGAWFGLAKPCPTTSPPDAPGHVELCAAVCGDCPSIPGLLPPELTMLPVFHAGGVFTADDSGQLRPYHTTAQGNWAPNLEAPQFPPKQKMQATYIWLQATELPAPSGSLFAGAIRARFTAYFDPTDPDRVQGVVQPYFFPFIDPGTGLAIVGPEHPYFGSHLYFAPLDPLASPLPACSPAEGCLGTYHFALRRIPPR